MGQGGARKGQPRRRRTDDAARARRAVVSALVRHRAGSRSYAPVTALDTTQLRVSIRARVSGALDLLLPRICVSCDQQLSHAEPGVVCGLCWSRLPRLPAPQCGRCGHPLVTESCGWCSLLPPFVRAVRSVCWMPAEPASGIVHALKYGGWSQVADEMAERMSRLSWPRDVVDERTALLPIPLASARKRERGYNQSALIADGLSKRWRVPVWENLVVRSRETISQTRLTPEQRLSNVAGSFRIGVGDLEAVQGAHLVIVDDVVTTAATLNACAKVLYDAGARIISYVTFGRAHASGDRL